MAKSGVLTAILCHLVNFGDMPAQYDHTPFRRLTDFYDVQHAVILEVLDDLTRALKAVA